MAEQARLKAERRRRGLAIVERMVADGVPISAEQVLAIAGNAPVGRPHIGRALVGAGVVSSVDEAFADAIWPAAPSTTCRKVDTDLFDGDQDDHGGRRRQRHRASRAAGASAGC